MGQGTWPDPFFPGRRRHEGDVGFVFQERPMRTEDFAPWVRLIFLASSSQNWVEDAETGEAGGRATRRLRPVGVGVGTSLSMSRAR